MEKHDQNSCMMCEQNTNGDLSKHWDCPLCLTQHELDQARAELTRINTNHEPVVKTAIDNLEALLDSEDIHVSSEVGDYLRPIIDSLYTAPNRGYPTDPTTLRSEARDIEIGAPDGDGYAGWLRACADKIETLELRVVELERSYIPIPDDA